MATAAQVLALHTENPNWGAAQIAHTLGCHDAYVRATARRNGLTLPRSPYGIFPTRGAAYAADRRATGESAA